MRTITCFGDQTSGTFLMISSVSRTKMPRSHGTGRLLCECFNSVTSPRVLSYRRVLHYLLTMPVGFNLYNNLTFGLKPQVDGIKIVVTV